jgi:isovaleryl-CoA dehydrogenase
MRASSMATLFFEDVVIPKENLLGVEGGGLVHMMRNLEVSAVFFTLMII